MSKVCVFSFRWKYFRLSILSVFPYARIPISYGMCVLCALCVTYYVFTSVYVEVYWHRHFQLVVYSQIEFKSLIEFWHFVGESFYLSRSTSHPLSFSPAHTIAVSQYACYFFDTTDKPVYEYCFCAKLYDLCARLIDD